MNNKYTLPKIISPFYDVKRIPRKLKKRVKKWCWVYWAGNDNNVRLWHYLEKKNPDYKRFIIKTICSYS